MDDPEPALLKLVAEPYDSVAEATDRLTTLEARLREAGDRRSVFLTIYVRMTRAVHEGLAAGAFEDPDWMETYLVSFANYYRRAFRDFERGALDGVPDPWRIAFGTSVRGDGLLLQDAYLGVNAHINYDLALALDDVGLDPNRERKYRDHQAINEILGSLVDAQQDALAAVYASGVADIDAAFGRFDELSTLRSMVEGREQAWRIAVVLTDYDWPPVPSLARWVLRATATGLALGIRSPTVDPTVLETLRRIEQDGLDVAVVLDELHDELEQQELG